MDDIHCRITASDLASGDNQFDHDKEVEKIAPSPSFKA